MLEFLPQNIKNALGFVNMRYVYEIRMRAGLPVFVNYRGHYRCLGEYGFTTQTDKGLYCDENDVSECVYRAGEYSVYSVEDQIKKGFITAKNGERIGLAGEYVYDKGQPLSVRRYTSLCIRIPHEIIGCGSEIYHNCMRDRVQSLLVMSAPGRGKTTILRDLGRIISERTLKNVLICDERGEISAGKTGTTCDVMKFADKNTAFDIGIRAMRPDIMITDELSLDDISAVKRAIVAGIIVLASAHFDAWEEVDEHFLGVFDRYVLLSREEIGKVREIYDKSGQRVA